MLFRSCGPDMEHDSTSLDMPAEDFTQSLGAPLKGFFFFKQKTAYDVRW